MYRGPIVDAHHHLWDLRAGRYPWLTHERPEEMVFGRIAPLSRDYLVEDLLADAQGQNLVKSVHVEAGWDRSDDPVAETRWLQSLADRQGFPHGLVVHAPLADPKVEGILERHLAFPNVRGVRDIVSWHADPTKTFVQKPDMLTDPAWRAGFKLLARHGLSFDLMLFPSQLADAAGLAAAFPEVQILLNHTGSPADRDASGLERWRNGMRELARCDNVAVKISDLVAYDHDWTIDSVRPFVRDTIEWFGVERCMFGSDFPVAGLHGTYAAIYDSFREIVADLSAAEQARLFHDNAVRYYRLEG